MSVSLLTGPRTGRTWSLRELDWVVVAGIGAVHALALAALWPGTFSWTAAFVVVPVLIWISGGLGVTLAYHRMLTHRSFRSPKWLEYLLTLCGTLAWQGGPIQWVGTHRIHHKHSDDVLDPHSPTHGFTWAHALWCLHKAPQGMSARDAAKDLQRDAVLRLIDRWGWMSQLVLAAGLYVVGQSLAGRGISAGGWSWVIWGVGVRTVIVYHATWAINSAAHTWGYRNFQTPDRSTNLWWAALLSFGEGWHNNHHAHQRSAAHGLRWFEVDLTYLTIRALALVGLARDVILPKSEIRHGRSATSQPSGQ